MGQEQPTISSTNPHTLDTGLRSATSPHSRRILEDKAFPAEQQMRLMQGLDEAQMHCDLETMFLHAAMRDMNPSAGTYTFNRRHDQPLLAWVIDYEQEHKS